MIALGTLALSRWVAAAVIVASASNANPCQDSGGDGGFGGMATSKECTIDTRGIHHESALVTDVVTVRCHPSPRSHNLEAWLEYRRETGNSWMPVGEPELRGTVPDAEGFSVRIAQRCQTGWWRTAWKTYGLSSDNIWFSEPGADAWGTEVEC